MYYTEKNVELAIKKLYLLSRDEIAEKEAALMRNDTDNPFFVIGYISLDIEDENVFCMEDSVETRELYFPIVILPTKKTYADPHTFKTNPITGEVSIGDGIVTETDTIYGICSAVYKKPGKEFGNGIIPQYRVFDGPEEMDFHYLKSIPKENGIPKFFVTVTITDEHPESGEHPQIIDVDYVYNMLTYEGDYIDHPTLALFNKNTNLTFPIL